MPDVLNNADGIQSLDCSSLCSHCQLINPLCSHCWSNYNFTWQEVLVSMIGGKEFNCQLFKTVLWKRFFVVFFSGELINLAFRYL